MTKEEIIRNLLTELIEMIDNGSQRDLDRADEISKTIIEALSQEPCDDIAQERYKDLCEYFGGAKDILKSREDFKAWLGRVKWHIHKAEELYEKYEYKKEPCDDAISRDAVLKKQYKIDDSATLSTRDVVNVEDIEDAPSVTHKSGKWIVHQKPHDIRYLECSCCNVWFLNDHLVRNSYCPNCGAKMESEE